MKWFKHMSASHTDEKLVELISECGMEGYGFWWMVMEIVAMQMDETGKCHATYSLPQWSHLLYSHHSKVSKVLSKLGVMGLVTVEQVESKIRVAIPNLLKYRDDYSKKSGQAPKKVRSKEVEVEVEVEREVEVDNNLFEIVEILPKIPYSEILAAYNSLCPSFAKAQDLSVSRKNSIRLRCAKYQKQGLDALTTFSTVFAKAEASDFISGRDGKWNGKRGIDWLLNEANMTKVLEGNYDNTGSAQGRKSFKQLDREEEAKRRAETIRRNHEAAREISREYGCEEEPCLEIEE